MREHIVLSHSPGWVLFQVDQFAFEAAEEVFGYGVVVGVAPAGANSCGGLFDSLNRRAFAFG